MAKYNRQQQELADRIYRRADRRTGRGVVVRTTDHDPINCPACNKRLEASTSLSGAVPEPGNISFCIDCNSLLVYELNSNKQLFLRLMTRAEANELTPEQLAEFADFAAGISTVMLEGHQRN